jgi:hypothetical protein
MGNILFHLQFPPPTLPETLVFDMFFESLDGWFQQVWNSATATLSANHVQLHAIASINSRALLQKSPYYPVVTPTWAKARTLKAKVRIVNTTNSGERFRIFTGNSDTPIGFGFLIENTKLYGRSGNGTLENIIELEQLPAAPYDLLRNLRAEFTPGSKVIFYVDDILKGELTTRLPTGTDGAVLFAWLEAWAINAFTRDLYVSQFRLTQEV